MSTHTQTQHLAAACFESNAHLIHVCAELGYLQADWLTLDPTYGRGNWWNDWCPNDLVKHDLANDGVDFRDLPYEDDVFDAAVFDPPYVCVGGRKTSSPEIESMYDSYGLIAAPKRPVDLQFLINDGLLEVARVVKPRGFILAKCQDYISSGKFFPGTHYTICCALDAGLEYHDRLEYIVEKPRPQPKRKRQLHARRNLSTLLVFRAPKKKKRHA